MAVVPDPHVRLPDLPGHEGSGHHQEGVRATNRVTDFKLELTGTYRKWTYCVQYRETDFNFVSRLMEQEGIALLLPAHRRPQHDGADRFDEQARDGPGLREAVVHRRRPSRCRPELEHVQRLGLRARDPARRLRARRLRSRAAERRAEDEQVAAAQLHAERLRGVRLSGLLHAEGRRRAVRVGPHRRTGDAVRDGAGGDQRARPDRRRAVHARGSPARRSEPRVPDRGRELRPDVRGLRSAAGGWRHGLSLFVRRDAERAAVPPEADHAEAVRAGPADRGRRRTRAARRSTPTSTAA